MYLVNTINQYHNSYILFKNSGDPNYSDQYEITNSQDASIKAKELKYKLDMDWTHHLKGVLNWSAADYEDIMKAIQVELLVKDLKLTKKSSLISIQMDTGESLKELITRPKMTATVCYLMVSFSCDEILILSILRAVPQELHTKILQHLQLEK